MSAMGLGGQAMFTDVQSAGHCPRFPEFLFQFQCSSLPAECVAARRPYVTVRRMKAQRRFVSGPCIARLLARHRVSVNEAMRAGRYGRLFHIGRIVYVALTE